MARAKKRKPLAEINVVPYIDVMLVLLVVFMITAPLLMQGIRVELPQTSSAPMDDDDEEPIIVSIDVDGNYYLNMGDDQKTPKSINDIAETVGKVLRNNSKKTVLVWGDTKVPYGQIVSLMSKLQGAGAESVGLVTEPPDFK